ncbi:MAG: flavin reductase [Bacteroidales bacterium]
MFDKVSLKEFVVSPFHKIGKDWMLITAGTEEEYNMMTASWGGFGFLWNQPVAFIFVRPQRYTYKFLEDNDWFTLSFFTKTYKSQLTFCGTRSGKDTDKTEMTGFKPVVTDQGNIIFEQAQWAMECRKVYYDDLNPDQFIDRLINRNYPNKDYHRMYIGKITELYRKTRRKTK